MSKPKPTLPQHLLTLPQSVTPTPPPTAEQKAQIAELVQHFSKEGYALPTTEGGTDAVPLSERELMYLSNETLLRFLRAAKTGVPATIARLEHAIVWRRGKGLDDIERLEKETEHESKMGKHFVLGFSEEGRPLMYMFPSRNSLPLEERTITHSLFVIERAQDLMCGGVTQVHLFLSLSGKRKGPPTSVSAAREALYSVGEFYPELLGRAIITDMPWYVRAFVSIMWPFVDPATKAKVVICSGQEAIKQGLVEGEVLISDCGGELEWEYDFDSYWPEFMRLCRERREEHVRLWRGLEGPLVGREERLFKVPPAAKAE